MNIKRTFFLFIIFFFIGVVCVQSQIIFTEEEKAWITEHPEINFGYEANWPPYEIYINGEYTGIVGDYVKLIEKHTGIDMNPIPGISWGETISKLKSGEIHIAPIAGITDARKEYLEFTKPYVSDPLVIVTRNDYQFISGLNDLENKKLSLPQGYYTIDMIKKDFPNIEIVKSNSIKDCLLKVSTSGSDAFVGSLSVVSYYINTFGFANLKIASPTNYGYTEMGLAVTKDWRIFRDIVQKILDNTPKEQHNLIKNKWISVRYDHGVSKEKITSYVIYSVFGLLVIALSFYLWNSTLRKQIKNRKKAELKLHNSLELIQQKNSEKEVLLKEIHHRVKNNLQIVHSLLNMQSREVVNKDALIILEEGKSRIKAMALVHQILYQSNNLSKIDIKSYVKSLLENIVNINHDSDKHIEVYTHADNVSLELDKIIPLGLILNELLTNSYKHAFKGRDSGIIDIFIKKEEDKYYFEYKDNGIGIENLNVLEYKSLGMHLIIRLSNQLNTQAVFKNDNGFVVSFSFE